MDDLDALIDQAIAVVPALPRGPRRPKAGEAPTVLRPITPEDFPLLMDVQTTAPKLQKLRTTHHLAARCIAEGKSQVEAAEISGYSVQRIWTLTKDPAFTNLVEEYKKEVRERWLHVHDRLAALGMAITEEFQERLENDPEKLTNEDLRRWAETVLDRGGFGPSKTANVNVKSQSATLHLIEMIKQESEGSANVKLLAAE